MRRQDDEPEDLKKLREWAAHVDWAEVARLTDPSGAGMTPEQAQKALDALTLNREIWQAVNHLADLVIRLRALVDKAGHEPPPRRGRRRSRQRGPTFSVSARGVLQPHVRTVIGACKE